MVRRPFKLYIWYQCHRSQVVTKPLKSRTLSSL